MDDESLTRPAHLNADCYTAETSISDVINDPVFSPYGRLIFPVDPGYMTGRTLGSLSLA